MSLPATYTATELADIEACRALVIEFATMIDENRTDELRGLLMPDYTGSEGREMAFNSTS